MQYNLALAYYQLNQFEAARQPLENTLKRWPDLFQLNMLYGAVMAKLGDDLAAYQSLHHAHELNPEDSGTTDMLYLTSMALAQKTLTQKQSAEQDQQHAASLRYLEEAAELRRRNLSRTVEWPKSTARPDIPSKPRQKGRKQNA